MSLRWNDLVMTPVHFALESCLEGAVYGVRTACPTCGVMFNACLRSKLLELLFQYQDTIEEHIGFALGPRYHQEVIEWNGKAGFYQLAYPDVETLHVREVITSIPNFTEFSISPYIATVEVAAAYEGSDFCVAIVPRDLVDDPERLSFWRTNDSDVLQRIETQDRPGYPKIVGINWEIPLGKPGTPSCLSFNTIDVQHCDYMVLEIGEAEACTGTLLPVYPGTNDKIPVYKIENLDSGNVRYWFYAWSLVAPNMRNTVNLELGQFNKLLQSIEFRCFSSVEQVPVITEVEYTCDEGISLSTNELVQAELIYPGSGGIWIQDLDPSPCGCTRSPESGVIKLTVWYKTNPSVSNRLPDVSKALEALLYVVASELPVSVCGCGADIPFIITAQKPFDNIRVNQFTGAEVISQRYGSSFGRKKYDQKLSEIAKIAKSVEI